MQGRIRGRQGLSLFCVERAGLARQDQSQRIQDTVQFLLRRFTQGLKKFILLFFPGAGGLGILLDGAEQALVDQRNRSIIRHRLQQSLLGFSKSLLRPADDDHQADDLVSDFDGRDRRGPAQRGHLELLKRVAVNEQGLARERHQRADPVIERLAHFLRPGLGQVALGGQQECFGAVVAQEQPAQVCAGHLQGALHDPLEKHAPVCDGDYRLADSDNEGQFAHLVLEFIVGRLELFVEAAAGAHLAHLCQHALHGRDNFRLAGGPEQNIVGAETEGLDHILFLSLPGDNDERRGGPLRGQRHEQVFSAQAGQIQISNDQVGGSLKRFFNGGTCVRDNVHLITQRP